MKKTYRVLFAVTTLAAAIFVIYTVGKRDTRHMLSQVADEGYETAHDILFPGKSKRGGRLHFGPIIPS